MITDQKTPLFCVYTIAVVVEVGLVLIGGLEKLAIAVHAKQAVACTTAIGHVSVSPELIAPNLHICITRDPKLITEPV